MRLTSPYFPNRPPIVLFSFDIEMDVEKNLVAISKIHFECRRCGACCTGDPGIIYVVKDELTRIAEYLSLKIPFFIEKYLYPIKTGYSIREHADGRCFFYENGCTICPVRPYQCKTFPFWFENLRSLKKWKRMSKECPGIGCGPLHSKEQILKIVQSNVDLVVESHLKKIILCMNKN
ncbi:MAG: YkgJ family cysteine cluster protein [Desulfobacterales bacterium]